ncbi:hypothetical protein [Candidatus Poriferisodalis sp.]|uniref:hypothetical protein n=1 Tax=Candidatus Poriferisodalis sp. TaxID=3101277 RepID=UPI003B010827
MSVAIAAGLLFFSGAALLVAAAVGPRRRRQGAARASRIAIMLPAVKEGEIADLRLAGIVAQHYSIQRLIGLLAGMIVGAAITAVWVDDLTATLALTALLGFAGWQLPRQGARDTARKVRGELDHVIRLWIVLVAQQVSAGVEPASAMLTAAEAGTRPTWRLLHRHLLAAQNERRPAWEGLVDLVERYGLHNHAPAVAAFGLAAERGTRISDAVLVAAETLWRDNLQREREAAERRNQIIVLPATGVALALAAILVYPPFVSLTGGIIAGSP